MLKLKDPLIVHIPRLMQYYSRFSSHLVDDSITAVNVEIKQNEIKTEKFKNELPFLMEMNKCPPIYKPTEKTFVFIPAPIDHSEGQEENHLTNITGTLSIMENTQSENDMQSKKVSEKVEVLSTPDSANNVNSTAHGLKNPAVLEADSTFSDEPSNPLPVSLRSATVDTDTTKVDKESSVFMTGSADQVDLSTALVPLSLHCKEDHLIMASVIQDLHHMYNKTSETVGYWHLLAQDQGRLWYVTMDEFFKQPGTPQNYLIEETTSRLTALKLKSSTWLCEAKAPPKAPTDVKKPDTKPATSEESLIDKVKAALASIWKQIQEKKKSMEKKK